VFKRRRRRRGQPSAQHGYPQYAPAPPRNGLALAALIIAPIGILFGLIPLTGFIAVIAGLVAIPMGIAGLSRYKKNQVRLIRSSSTTRAVTSSYVIPGRAGSVKSVVSVVSVF
jgi:hypothetical protein